VQETTTARVAVIIVNYRTPALVIDCLRSLVPEIRPHEDVVIVVDNASGDGSGARIRADVAQAGWEAVHVIDSPHNGGFAAGNNFGIRQIRAAAYLLLNSDTIVRPGAIETLWSALESSEDIGLVSPRLEWPDGRAQISCFREHTPWSELIAGSSTGPIRNLLARWDVPVPVSNERCEAEWTSFAAVLIRSEVIERVGPLDEGFFMYYEDVDYCRSATQAGWRIVYEPAAHVVHLRGGSSPVKALTAAGKRRPRYYYQSRTRYFRKAFGRLGLFAANLLWTAGRAVAWLRETFGSKSPHTVERELLDLWRG